MKLYRFNSRQFLPVTRKQAWRFFSSPWNLVTITPRGLNMKIESVSGHGTLHAGQIIRLNITLLSLVRIHWETAVTDVKDLTTFTDTQHAGPFSRWSHRHIFTEVTGGTEIRDEIEYAVPFGILGRIANSLFVRRELRRLFAYRSHVLNQCFSKLE